jgi:hypothetical protein
MGDNSGSTNKSTLCWHETRVIPSRTRMEASKRDSFGRRIASCIAQTTKSGVGAAEQAIACSALTTAASDGLGLGDDTRCGRICVTEKVEKSERVHGCNQSIMHSYYTVYGSLHCIVLSSEHVESFLAQKAGKAPIGRKMVIASCHPWKAQHRTEQQNKK